MKYFVLVISLICFTNFSNADDKDEKKTDKTKKASETTSDDPRLTYKFTEADYRILNEGEISNGRYIFAGVVGSYFGFGLGHAMVGKYSDMGWKFTVGESISAYFLLRGLTSCVIGGIFSGSSDKDDDDDDDETCNNSDVTIGMVGLVFFRGWQIYDIWTTVPRHNGEYHRLKQIKDLQYGFYPIMQKNRAGLALTYFF